MEFSIPGIDLDLEPLEPFYDDVFAGMDEHPAGPWPHHILNPAELHQQQVQSTHYPAIDCNLLDEQEPAAAVSAVQQHQLASSPGAQLDALPGAAPAQQADGLSPAQPAAVPEALTVTKHEPQGEAAVSSGVLPAEHNLHHAAAAEESQAHGDVPGMLSSSSDVRAGLECPEHPASCDQVQLGSRNTAQEAGAGTLHEGDAGPAVAPMPACRATANTEHLDAGISGSGSDSKLAAEGESSAAEAATVGDADAAGDAAASTSGAVAGAEDSSMHAAGAATVDGPPNSSSCGSDEGPGPAADGTTVNNPAAGVEVLGVSLAAAVGAEPSSGSLPDIDGVTDEQEQQQEQQQEEHQQDEQQQEEQQQEPQQRQHASDSGRQQQVVDAAVFQPGPDSSSEAQLSASASLADGSDAPCSVEHRQLAADGHTSQSADDSSAAAVGSWEEQETMQLVSAAAVAGDSGAALPDEPQQPSVHEQDFGSPCSSWHSCVTAASKASSLNSSRGFFLQSPAPAVESGTAAGIAAALKAASSSTQETAGSAQQDASHGSMPQQQQASRSGVSSPAMVSSLHLALQQQQQQQHSQHSEQLAASATLDDPLSAAAGTASVSSLAAGIPEVSSKGATGSNNADDSTEDSSRDAEYGSTSQPIAVQCAHEHYQRQQQQDDPWQSVSPPSFSSSPGLLVSAVAARAAAAAATQDTQGTAANGVAAVADDAEHGPGGDAQAVEQLEEEGQQQEGPGAAEAEDEDIGHGCFYADAAGLSMSPEHGGMLYQQGLLQHHPHQHMAASSYMLRQSELVDLSLSTSMHPSQLQHMQQQQVHPGWLTAHQQLPPAAAQAVERAVVALNDSYCSPGRASPSELLGTAAAAAPAGSSGGARAMGVAAMGAVGGAIRRTGAGVHWNRAHTQPQQDQQARHRLPSQAAGPAGGFGWPGAAVLGDWFSAVQQPLAAAASRAAVGVGQRLGMAHGQHPHGRQGSAFARQHSSNRPAQQGMASTVGPGQSAGSSGSTGPSTTPSRLASASAADASTNCAEGPACSAGAEESLDDAVLVEKTSDLPQSLQEQEDEAFRGLLFLGGRDSQGRPVVIVNTDAIPAGHNSAPRDAALAYLLKRLSPVVTRGPYVLVIVALHHGPQFRLLPGVWCVRAYQSLPRAFRKNVKHVILLQPSMFVKAAVTLLYPFVSSKAHAKVKQVQRLLDIDAATRGEVQVPHLGEAFLTTIHHINSSRAREANSSM